MTRRRRFSTAIALNPAAVPRRKPSGDPSSSFAAAASACGRIRETMSAPQTNVPAVTRKTTPALVAARRPAPIAGPAKLPTLSIVLRVTFAAVSSSGLRASSGRIDDSAGGRSSEDRGEPGERVDGPRGAVGERDRAGSSDHRRPAEVRRRHHRDAREPVGKGAEERRADRCRDRADEGDDPDRLRTALLVGIDRDGDAVRPLPDDGADAGELQPPELRVGEVAPERARRLGQLLPQPAHSRRASQHPRCISRRTWEDFGRVPRLVGQTA